MKATPNQTGIMAKAMAKAERFRRISIREHKNAYTENAAAPATMERASVAAKIVPSFHTAIPRLASATDGAAPNNPAKLFG